MTTSELPPPMVPFDLDLDGFDAMLIDVQRLRSSRFDSIGDSEAWRAGVNLWFSSWLSGAPAGSLENDEATLCKAAGLGRDMATWTRVRSEALRHWRPCSDGRLYHPTVCETALGAWLERLTARKQSGAGNSKRWGIEIDAAQLATQLHDAMDALERLAPRSEVLKKFRKRYGRRDPNGPTPARPNGSNEQGFAGDGGPESPNGLANGVPQGSQADADADADGSSSIPPTPFDEPGAKVPPEVWLGRIDELHRLCGGLLDGARASARNPTQLRKLIEVDGLAWPDVRDAVVAICKSHGTTSRPIYSFGFGPIIDTAHGNAAIRKGEHNGQRTDRPNGNGQAASGLAGAVARRMLLASDDPKRDDGGPRPRSAAEELRDEMRDLEGGAADQEAARAGE